MVDHVEILVEERSMAEALRSLLPALLPATNWQVYEHRSKDDLLKRLPARLRGYASWVPANWRILVIVDRDDDDCVALKQQLENLALNAGLATKSSPRGQHYVVVNRLAVEELEAWFFGDWKAVRSAYPKVDANVPAQAPYRDPDAIKGGTWEAFERVLQAAGYFRGGLAKVTAARAVAEHMDPSLNRSASFCALRDVLREIAAG